MAPINAEHAEEAVNRVAAFFEVLDARPAEETSEAVNALRESLDLDTAAMAALLAGGGRLLTKRTDRTADEMRVLKAALGLGIYLGLTAEQLRQESEAVTA